MNQAKILAPRRGLKSVMDTVEKSAIVLATGELFIETDDDTGVKRIKIGDGITPYGSLPYALSSLSENIQFDDSSAGLSSNNVQDALDTLTKRVWTGTEEQYNAIEVKDPETTYFITDPSSRLVAVYADTVSYYNGISGLESNTVQNAIDELAIMLESNIQFKTMPVASAEFNGKIYQYIGENTSNYIRGLFYRCSSDTFLDNFNVGETLKATNDFVYQNSNANSINYLISRASSTSVPVIVYIDEVEIATVNSGQSYSGILPSGSVLKLTYEAAYPTSECTLGVSGNGYFWKPIDTQTRTTSADKVSYDNASSKLESNDVKSALDELNTNIKTESARIDGLTKSISNIVFVESLPENPEPNTLYLTTS